MQSRTRRKKNNDKLRWCVGCQNYHPKTEFYKNGGMKDGLQPSCKKHMSAKSKEWYQNNKHKRLVGKNPKPDNKWSVEPDYYEPGRGYTTK